MHIFSRSLEVFMAVGHLGSFSAAAESLGITQPAVSRQIAALEARLGQPLFSRSKAGARPTPAAKDLLQALDAATSLAHKGLRQARANAASPSTLSIGVSLTEGSLICGDMAASFKRLHPSLDLRIVSVPFGVSPLELLASGQLDAVETPRLSPSLAAEVEFAPVTHDQLVLCVPPQHRLAGIKGPATLEDLRGEKILVFPPGILAEDLPLCDPHKLAASGIASVEFDHPANVVEYIAGDILVPTIASLASRRFPLVPVALEHGEIELGFAISREPSPVTREFIAHALAVAGDHAPAATQPATANVTSQ